MNYTFKAHQIEHKQYNKVFIFIVDALRVDFITPVEVEEQISSECNVKEIHAPNNSIRNRFKSIKNLLESNSSQTILLGFRGDPPTVTSQRLKALTTGTLPTFIDIGSNFDSAEILEDNFITQMRTANKSLTFMGDDTWSSVYPHSFQSAHPFDSFNTK
eukprot:gene6157-12467_t